MNRLSSARCEARGWVPAVLLALLACGLDTLPAAAQTTYYWAPTGTFASGGAGTWSTANAWRTDTSTGSLATYANGENTAIVGGTSNAAYTITLTGSLQVNTIRLDASTGSGKTVTINNPDSFLQMLGPSPTIYGSAGRTLTFGTSTAGGTKYRLSGTGVLTLDGGGSITFNSRDRFWLGSGILVANNTLVTNGAVQGMYIADATGTNSLAATVVSSGTLALNAANNLTSPIVLGTTGVGGGVLSLNAAQAAVAGFTLTVGGTSKSRIASASAANARFRSNTVGGTIQFTINSTGDPSGVDLDYEPSWRNGTFEKLGAGTMRLAVGGTFNQQDNSTTYFNTGTTLRVAQGTFRNEGTILSIANVAGGVLTTTSTAGTFDQVNVTSGTFEIARSSSLFSTLSGTTYAAGNSALNPRGGTLRYVGVTTDYSASMGTLGGVASTIDTNGQSVSFATGLSGTGGLTKAGAGALALNGTSSYTGLTSVSAGDLRINGAVGGDVSVAAGAALGGSGRFAGLGGAGLVAPGNSPGILTGTGSVNPTGGLDFAFEITGTAPLWSNPTASVNDVLRITNTTPFTAALASGVNTVSVYLDVATLGSGDEFLGGFFTDRTTGLAADVTSATYEFYVSGTGGGSVPYNGTSYFTLANWIASPQNTGGVTGINVGVRTVPTANFTGGDATGGQSTLFVVVPEPATVAAGLVGLAAAAWAARRRRAVRYDPEG